MSSSDISRFLRQPGKHYVGARLQQGRILTDADFNEGSWLGEEDRRKALADFGPRGSPDQGFSIGAPLDLDAPPPPPAQTPALRPGDVVPIENVMLGDETVPVRSVSIRAGAMHLGGMRFELEGPQPIMFQRDFLQMTRNDIAATDLALAPLFNFYYLNAWEQCISAVEDSEFLEPALGGVDTSLRVRRMRRVEMRSNATETNCTEAFEGLIRDLQGDRNTATFDRATGELRSNGRLFFTRAPGAQGPDCATCNPSPSARYLGADNQTLRLMLTAPDRFVWALDDGAPLYRAEVTGLDEQSPAEVRVTLLTPPRDAEHFPLEGRVVEILPFAALLDKQQVGDSVLDPHFNKAAAEIGAFTRVLTPFDPVTGSFTVDLSAPGLDAARAFVHQWDTRHPDANELMSPIPPPPPPGHVRAFYVRFWHVADASNDEPIEIPIPDAQIGPALGTTGLVPNFPVLGRAGDFWIATLRPDSPERPVVPFDLLARPNEVRKPGSPPDGPRHFYAPLAFVSGHLVIDPDDPDAGLSAVDENADCRLRIRPLADDGCTKVTVGDCRTSIGQFTVIQDAIDALPPEGGVVTILPGLYRENLVILDRPGVILEGCGDATVLESPNPFNDVIHIHGQSPGVRIRSLKVNGGARGIFATAGADDLRLSSLHVVGDAVPGAGFAQLVSVTGCTGVTLEALQVEESGGNPIELVGCTGVVASGLEITGSAVATILTAPEPAVRIVNCFTVTLRDSSLHTFGQVGVSVSQGSSGIVLEGLSVTAEPFMPGPLLARAAIDIDDATSVSVLGCRIQQVSVPVANVSLATVGIDAAVVVHGVDILVENNEITANDFQSGRGAAVWGGVQIRGGSSRTIVRGNHISGGVGHGITLGSVSWQDADNAGPRQRFGAGKGQIEGDSARGFGANGMVFPDDSAQNRNPITEGGLTDVVIEGNRIERMNTNGISTFAMLGVQFEVNNTAATEFIQLDGLRIDNNTIVGNIAHPPASRSAGSLMISPSMAPDGPQDVDMQRHALGGIVLSDIGTGAEIRGNLIRGNGASQAALPISGIFIVVGEAITICNNRILENGGAPAATQATGVRGGIVILYAGTGSPAALSELQEQTFQLGGNELSNDGSSLRVLNNVVRHPEGRALYVVAAGPVTVSGNFLSSDGFHGSGQDQYALGDVVLVQDIGGPWERFDVAELATSTPNPDGSISVFLDYQTPTRTANYLFNALATSPRLFVGVGGQVSFVNNQVTFDFLVRHQPPFGVPLAIFPVALMTLDHLSVTGNQLAFRLRGFEGGTGSPLPPPGTIAEPVLAHLFAAGATSDVSGNRLSEAFGIVHSSLFSLAELVNYTTYNQTTHPIYTGVSKSGGPVQPTMVTDGNQVMFNRDPSGLADLDKALHLFFQLLFRSTLNTIAPTVIPPPPGD